MTTEIMTLRADVGRWLPVHHQHGQCRPAKGHEWDLTEAEDGGAHSTGDQERRCRVCGRPLKHKAPHRRFRWTEESAIILIISGIITIKPFYMNCNSLWHTVIKSVHAS